MNPIDVLKYGHLFFQLNVDAFPADQRYTGGVAGYWSVKDLVAHMASFELVLVEALEYVLDPCPTPLLAELLADGQAFNDRQVDQKRGKMTYEDAWAEYAAAYGRSQAIAQRVQSGAWQQKGILPAYGDEYDLGDFVVYTYYGHKREHGGQIQVYGDRFRR